jgi:hypothetical protein
MTAAIKAIGTEQSRIVTAESRWTWLYRVGGAAALITAIFLPIQIIVFLLYPPPSTITGWFALFQSNKLIGLLDLDLLMIADQILLVPILLVLYITLRQTSESFIAIGMTLWFVAIVAFFASNPSFSMLSLSDGYAAATTDAQRAMFLAAGQAAFANWQGTAFQIFYFLGSIAPIIISVVMLRSNCFAKAIAYLGILGNVVAFGLYFPPMGVYISLISVVVLEIWYILVGRRLFRLAKEARI